VSDSDGQIASRTGESHRSSSYFACFVSSCASTIKMTKAMHNTVAGKAARIMFCLCRFGGVRFGCLKSEQQSKCPGLVCLQAEGGCESTASAFLSFVTKGTNQSEGTQSPVDKKRASNSDRRVVLIVQASVCCDSDLHSLVEGPRFSNITFTCQTHDRLTGLRLALN